MKKLYSLLGKTIKIVAYVALILEVVEALRAGIVKIHPEVLDQDKTYHDAGHINAD